MSLRILVSAGEVSGDAHLAGVARALSGLNLGCQIRGMAGDASEAAGITLDVNCYKAGAGMGFLELFRSGGKILSSFRVLSHIVRSWKPDLLVVVDYPDFNLRLARLAKRVGVPVLYFIPPKVWAWRTGRVQQIKKYVDHVAAIFPFEPEFYALRGYQHVSYVGHPLADRTIPQVGDDSGDRSLLLLPGSRAFEVERLLLPLLQACEKIADRHPALKPTVLLAPNIDATWARKLVSHQISASFLDRVTWSHNEPLEEMCRARVAVLKSGTCNLEGALARLPFVCVYSGTHLAKFIISRFVSLREYSPVNIIRPRTVDELMQVHINPDDVVSALEPLIEDGPKRYKMLEDLSVVARELSSCGDGNEGQKTSVAERVARMIISMASNHRETSDDYSAGASHV